MTIRPSPNAARLFARLAEATHVAEQAVAPLPPRERLAMSLLFGALNGAVWGVRGRRPA